MFCFFSETQCSKTSQLIEKISNNQADCRRSLRLSTKGDNSLSSSQKTCHSMTYLPTSTTNSLTSLLEQNNFHNNQDSQSRIWKAVCDKVRPFGSAHTDSSARDDGIFSETDEEISEINSHMSNQTPSSSSRSSSRLSCKRKRTNTLSADLEVESLLESGTESVSSLDTRSLSDFSGALNLRFGIFRLVLMLPIPLCHTPWHFQPEDQVNNVWCAVYAIWIIQICLPGYQVIRLLSKPCMSWAQE